MFAVIKTGGKQYRVTEGDMLYVEKLGLDDGATLTIDQVLSVENGDEFSFGTPFVAGASVEAMVVKNGKGKKIRIFKYKAKKNYRRRQGHRQPYTKIQINKINVE